MTKELFNKHITKFINISSEECENIISFFTLKKFAKKTILLHAGEVCRFEAFVIKGCLKTYFIDKNGFEVILTFATENWWVSDIASFQQEKPSQMWIETIEDCEMLMINQADKERLLSTYPVLEKMFRLLVQRHLVTYQERLFGNIALTAKERYEVFLHKYPALPQRIPQHLIASYLGVSPEFLSRLRNKKKNP
ncbi:MAG: Crp/Fnr family transcriptional regulator [Saprospiraceae bacterium]|nr:Crp/Fnr family transcriptional regulator [Saprospiraceae bacterium]